MFSACKLAFLLHFFCVSTQSKTDQWEVFSVKKFGHLWHRLPLSGMVKNTLFLGADGCYSNTGPHILLGIPIYSHTHTNVGKKTIQFKLIHFIACISNSTKDV